MQPDFQTSHSHTRLAWNAMGMTSLVVESFIKSQLVNELRLQD